MSLLVTHDPVLVQAAQPVRAIPTDPPGDSAVPGIALCLSGGGYRAMLFHLGALWRLNELGYLPKLDRVSSVSGGSITAAILGLNWGRLAFDAGGVARDFESAVVRPVRSVATRTVDVPTMLGVLIPHGPIGNRLANAFRRHIFGVKTLQDLPDRPVFVFASTNLASGVLWRFSKPYMWDYRVGQVPHPSLLVATAVAASAAFPPFLSPVVLRFQPSDYVPGTGFDLQRPPFTTRVTLADGGVYDNLGLETAWKKYQTVLVSDGGMRLRPLGRVRRNWLLLNSRVEMVIDSQVRSLRKRQVIGGFKANQRKGTYWGIRSQIADYQLPDVLPCAQEDTHVLACTPTRLRRLPSRLQEGLINWGYAVCDAAMRSHVDQRPPPTSFPYPDIGVRP